MFEHSGYAQIIGVSGGTVIGCTINESLRGKTIRFVCQNIQPVYDFRFDFRD